MNNNVYFEDEKIRISMKTKLMILFLIVGIIPLIIMGYRAFMDQRIVIRDLIISANSEIANVVAKELNQKIITAHQMLNSTSRLPSFQEHNLGEEIETILRTTVQNFSIFNSLYFVDRYGEEGLAAISDFGVRVETLEKVSEIDSNILKFWYEGIVRGAGVGKGFYSDVYFRRNPEIISEEVIEPYQLMGVYVTDKLSDMTGVLIAEIKLSDIWEIVDRIRVDETGFAFVVEEKSGMLIAHSNPNINPGIKFLDNKKMEELISFGEGGSTVLDRHSQTVKLCSYVPTQKYSRGQVADITDLFTPEWGVVVEQTEREAFEPARQLMYKILFIVVLGTTLAILLAILFAHGITRSMKTLHLGALNIANGDLTQELFIDSEDEVGELANAFDKMRLTLKKKINDLKILYEISQTISAVLDYRELLAKIMDITVRVLDAEKGSIMLFDDETEMLKIEAAYGLPEEIQRDALINPNKGIVAWVLRTGKPLLIYDTMKEAGFEKMKGRKAESGTLLSAPLKVKDKLLGVVNISKSIPNTYTDSDKELFTAIVLQAAIAIEKAILYRMAITDGMTKLYLHRYFQQRFDEELARAIRYKKPLSMIMMDIDHFKPFNDTYGHQVGDRVLKTVARIVEKSVRDVDIPARYGGEEFAVILPEKDSEGAEIPAERIRKNIAEHEFYVDDKLVPITISLGISSYPEHSDKKGELIECADNALYFSKETGRNKYAVYSEEIFEKLKKLKEDAEE
ncbi:MAG: diguanylate cyclase [Candidatus Muiribacteriota bacterium]